MRTGSSYACACACAVGDDDGTRVCITECNPLPVEHFTPHCSRRNRGGYFCPGVSYELPIDAVCSCGSGKATTPTAKSSDAPDLVTPVIVHHGLKKLLDHRQRALEGGE